MQGFYLYSKCPLGVNTTVVCQNLALKKVLGIVGSVKYSKNVCALFTPEPVTTELARILPPTPKPNAASLEPFVTRFAPCAALA